MTGFGAALATEILKARRGRALWFAGLGYMLLPLVGGLFMIILKDPAAARNMGLISAKAQLAAGVADWPAFFGMLSQGTAIGGTVVYALGTSWVFGREYADHTLKDLLALPTPRSALVAAKLLVLLAWGLALAAAACLVGIAVGSAIGLPGWSPAAVTQAVANLAVTAVLTLSLVTPIALAASIGRGYLPALGCALLLVFLAQISAVLGWGAYFPWAVPALYSGMAGPSGAQLAAPSFLLVALTSILGAVGTLAWWENADQAA